MKKSIKILLSANTVLIIAYIISMAAKENLGVSVDDIPAIYFRISDIIAVLELTALFILSVVTVTAVKKRRIICGITFLIIFIAMLLFFAITVPFFPVF